MCDFVNGIATFVMPHWRNENVYSKNYLDEAICSIENQTDHKWHLVIVDDCSPCRDAVDYLEQIRNRLNDKVTIIKLHENSGAGIARNKGIEWAYHHHSPFILFLDADDICHQKRLEVVRRHFVSDCTVNVVYSTFEVIDEAGLRVSNEKIDPSIKEILNGHKKNVVEGENAWIQIATEKNYTNLTSSTAVRTDIAYNTPFPNERVSEDAHTWMRYGAHKGKFVYDESIPSLYRIPSTTLSASASRDRLTHFCENKIRVDTDGFFKAMQIALENENITCDEERKLLACFYVKLAESMAYAGNDRLKNDLLRKAISISPKIVERKIREKGLDSHEKIAPFDVVCLDDIEANKEKWRDLGMQELINGHIAIVLLSGGLGSRLGFDVPKGMVNIGINKTLYLFEIIIKKIKNSAKRAGRCIDLYIMVNEEAIQTVRAFFEKHSYFGYEKDHIIFFTQIMKPKLLFDGKPVLDQNGKPEMAPCGNGVWIDALKKRKLDKKMEKDGIKWINLLSIDNPLYTVVDTTFLGALIDNKGQLGVQVVKKKNPREKVGVICKKDGRAYVKEYYELTDDERSSLNSQEQLKYQYGVILNYMFKFSDALAMKSDSLPTHMAVKNNCYIEERLALDMIPLFDNVMAYEVDRTKSFAPIKNRTGIDSLESARKMMLINGYDL